MRHVTVLLLAAVLAGCAGTKSGSKQELVTPQFDWNPPETMAPASAEVTFGVCGGSYAEDEDWITEWPFDAFAKNMAADFNELLTARGFTTTGPFRDMDEMTFPDKKGCDLILEPDLDVTIKPTVTGFDEHVQLLGTDYYTLKGEVVVSGRVNLSVLESLSGTRMWNKSIEVPRIAVAWKGEQRFAEKPSGQVMMNEPAINNVLAGPLEDAYNNILSKAWTYLDPEEMQVVKAQAMEVKEKTRYSGQ